VPIPAERTHALGAFGGGEMIAYLLAGTDSRRGYVYEVEGDEVAFGPLLAELARYRSELLVNCHEGSRFHKWAFAIGFLAWSRRQLTMWKVFDKALTDDRLRGMPIGYLDVI
jgi:hypothetical protein